MGIHTEYQAVVTCDECGDNEVEAWRGQKEVIAEVRKLGWSVGKKVRCPKCKAKGKGE